MAPEVDGHVALTGGAAGAVPGTIGTATITAAYPYHLKGRWHGTD
jgi:hypothetical protein